jgi:hypothetical protein
MLVLIAIRIAAAFRKTAKSSSFAKYVTRSGESAHLWLVLLVALSDAKTAACAPAFTVVQFSASSAHAKMIATTPLCAVTGVRPSCVLMASSCDERSPESSK